MAYFRCGGGGIPSSLKTDMNSVLNKKFGTTSQDYPPNEWADNVNLLGKLPERTASGSIAHFDDGADDVPLKTARFYFNPVQAAGTPTPSSPIAISGHTGLNITKTGANVWGGQGMAETFSNCNGYSLDTTNKIVKFKRSSGGVLSIPKTKENTQYTWFLTYSSTENNNSVYLAYSDGTTPTFSLPSTSGTKTTFVITSTANKTLIGYGVKWQSEIGEISLYYDESGFLQDVLTAQDFEAYEGTTYPVSWTSHGTIYGGYYNSKTGELWKTDEIKNLSALTWRDYGNNIFYAECVGKKAGMTNLLMSEYSYFSGTYANMTDNTFKGANSNAYIYVKDNRYSTATEFSESVTAQVVYELDTPVLVGIIDPTKVTTYEGINNIYHDANGDSTIEYRADIDLLITELGG